MILCRLLKSLRITIKGTNDFDQAQICAGGVRTEEVDPKTMESHCVSGLYFAGELLDVDGICGGYTFSGHGPVGLLQEMCCAKQYRRKGKKNMIQISQLKLPCTHTQQELREKIERTLRIRPEELIEYSN